MSFTVTFLSAMADDGLSSQVLEYLSKKGYNRTEATLRMESANQDVDGRPIHTRVEESGGVKYGKAFGAYKRLALTETCSLVPRPFPQLDRREPGNL